MIQEEWAEKKKKECAPTTVQGMLKPFCDPYRLLCRSSQRRGRVEMTPNQVPSRANNCFGELLEGNGKRKVTSQPSTRLACWTLLQPLLPDCPFPPQSALIANPWMLVAVGKKRRSSPWRSGPLHRLSRPEAKQDLPQVGTIGFSVTCKTLLLLLVLPYDNSPSVGSGTVTRSHETRQPDQGLERLIWAICWCI